MVRCWRCIPQGTGGKRKYNDVALYEAAFGLMKNLVQEFLVSGYVCACAGASLTRCRSNTSHHHG
ncbi:hypothetical protein THIARS_50016 [Thiomonas delicata]|uniref:Uncharacterized protein n=1 Tax=Thiomonas delicata TaxID=364030 RepID=A0A238D0H8_THIDL|nr:hypothetical protein THIARS_50016 [Thiomonas delicata]